MIKSLLFTIPFALVTLFSCDPERKKECEWYLMPEPSLKSSVDPGFIPVCARNLTSNKQYCRLQAKIEFAKKFYGKKFRFVDMDIETSGRFPRKVLSIKTCE